MEKLTQKEFIDTYSKYKEYIQDMYMFECLTTSGFTEYQAYMLRATLQDLWLKDENCRCISGLSDMLYEYAKANDLTYKELTDIPTRTLLVKLYMECDY